MEAVSGLNDEQLNWRMFPGSLTLGEMALHVAGVEVSFVSQLMRLSLDEPMQRLKLAATDGVVNDQPFPYPLEQVTAGFVAQALESARLLVEPAIENPNQEIRSRELVSALGPVITGEGAFARLAFHPAYHQGQAHLIRTSPDFPTS